MNYEHSSIINKSRCPRCAQLGMDTRGDNLVNYSDGHCFCYACGYLSNPLHSRLSNLTVRDSVSVVQNNPVKLPSDIGIDYPQKVIDWIGSYELTINDLHNHNFLWSESYERLLYPVWGGEAVLFWTGRYFGHEANKPKWLNKGSPKDLIHCLNKNARVIVIVEDIISGIKILNTSKDYGVLVLFNSHNPVKKLLSLDRHKYFLWLDNDKSKESIFFTREGVGHGLDIKTIISLRDPKDEAFTNIKGFIQ